MVFKPRLALWARTAPKGKRLQNEKQSNKALSQNGIGLLDAQEQDIQ